jgi:hypothetical protein
MGCYKHAHQFKRELKFVRIRLGRVVRDIRRSFPTSGQANPTPAHRGPVGTPRGASRG